EGWTTPGPALEIDRGFHVHERQRHELGEAARLFLQLPDAQKVSRPMLVAIDVTEHDGRGAAQAAAMCGTHHLEPLIGADLVAAEHGAHLVVEDFRRRAWQRAEPRRLQRVEKICDRNAERRRALMHFER